MCHTFTSHDTLKALLNTSSFREACSLCLLLQGLEPTIYYVPGKRNPKTDVKVRTIGQEEPHKASPPKNYMYDFFSINNSPIATYNLLVVTIVVYFHSAIDANTPLAHVVASLVETCAGGALASSHWCKHCTGTRATCTVGWW